MGGPPSSTKLPDRPQEEPERVESRSVGCEQGQTGGEPVDSDWNGAAVLPRRSGKAKSTLAGPDPADGVMLDAIKLIDELAGDRMGGKVVL